ncbi:MAG: HlyC/CorC family transporter [Solirubrobacterales bacterium]|nr:HlyC/CorC family transporter [Solirubrobacterales bacterium]
MIEVLLLLAGVVLVLLCGLFVAAEFSFVTVDRVAVERDAEEGDRTATGLRRALETLSTQLSASQVGITVTNLGIGFLAEPALAGLLEGPLEALGVSGDAVTGVAVAVGFILANAFTVVFGELVPKNLAIAHPMGTARRVQSFQRSFTLLFGPVIRGANGSANRILRRIGIEPQEELAATRSAEELASLVRRSAEQGLLEQKTAELMERSVEFGEHRADDVMTPRVRVETVQPDEPVAAVIEAARRSGRSRFPVIEEGEEQVEGVVHLKHAVAVPFEQRGSVPVREVMAQPVLVPSSIELDPLLTELRQVGLQIAVVVDEFGSFDGIVTLEDLVEEIVGEVRDEHDPKEDPVVELGPRSWRVSGLLRPDEIEDRTGIALPENEEYETAAGLIAFHLERVPGQGDYIGVDAKDRSGDGGTVRVRLSVVRMDGLRVDRVKMEVLGENEETGEMRLP